MVPINYASTNREIEDKFEQFRALASAVMVAQSIEGPEKESLSEELTSLALAQGGRKKISAPSVRRTWR